MDLQRADAGRLIDDAGEPLGGDGLFNRLHQRMHAEAQRDIEHDGTIFDQEIGIARTPIGERPKDAVA